jgi:hypothetical protein
MGGVARQVRQPARRLRARRGLGVLFALLVAGALLTACGTHGSAPPLPPTAHATLTAQGSSTRAGTATLTPAYGGRVVAYLGGKQIPYQNAQTPVQLRQGSCTGPVLAALTENAPGPTGSQAQSAPALHPDAAGGVDIALNPDENWYIVVLDHAGDARAQPIACGHPLSGKQQYFDLYPPDQGENGDAKGIALLQPQVYTQVAVSLDQPAGQNETWAIREQSCGGTTVTAGTLANGARTASGTAFAPPDSGWWISVAPDGNNGGVCGQVRG